MTTITAISDDEDQFFSRSVNDPIVENSNVDEKSEDQSDRRVCCLITDLRSDATNSYF